MRGFSTALTETVTLTRGEEEIPFVIRPQPVGYYAWLRAQYPPPVLHSGSPGKPNISTPDEAGSAEYEDLFTFALLVKCLEPGTMEAMEPKGSPGRGAWQTYAAAIRDEFIGAGFTPGEIRRLLTASIKLTGSASVKDQEERRGN